VDDFGDAAVRDRTPRVAARSSCGRVGSTVLAKASGPQDTDAPFTANLSVTRKLPAGTVITAVARHDSSSGVALEPNSGQYVHIDLAGI
jgi:hypothetical protein